MNKNVIILTIIFAIAILAAAVFIWRYQILQYSIEGIIRKNLPPYVRVERMNFDLKAGKAVFMGFRVKNPPGFSHEFLLVIDEISCRYETTGKSIMKLPEEFTVRSGRVVFMDKLASRRPHTITFDNVESNIYLKLDDSYSKVMRFAAAGSGNLNGDETQVIGWSVSWDPNTPRLTMSSRFEVTNLDIPVFEPYYDRYSPFVFRQGRFSGTLIFDFDNGNIGSTNEVHLRDIVFSTKPGYENAVFWETSVPELIRYFSSPDGDIVFDFKIKGDMANPKFYLGPISKRALASMAVDKISTMVEQVSGKDGKVKDYVGLFKSLLNP